MVLVYYMVGQSEKAGSHTPVNTLICPYGSTHVGSKTMLHPASSRSRCKAEGKGWLRLTGKSDRTTLGFPSSHTKPRSDGGSRKSRWDPPTWMTSFSSSSLQEWPEISFLFIVLRKFRLSNLLGFAHRWWESKHCYYWTDLLEKPQRTLMLDPHCGALASNLRQNNLSILINLLRWWKMVDCVRKFTAHVYWNAAVQQVSAKTTTQ